MIRLSKTEYESLQEIIDEVQMNSFNHRPSLKDRSINKHVSDPEDYDYKDYVGRRIRCNDGRNFEGFNLEHAILNYLYDCIEKRKELSVSYVKQTEVPSVKIISVYDDDKLEYHCVF
jgi:hypothetical protein